MMFSTSAHIWSAPTRGSVIEVVNPVPMGVASTTVHSGSVGRDEEEARLPEQTWVRSKTWWQLIPRLRHESRRTGLDPPGLRIVLLCSVVQRMLAEDAAFLLEPTISVRAAEAGWAAARRYRTGVLGTRHWLSKYGYEHRRCDGDGALYVSDGDRCRALLAALAAIDEASPA